MIKRVVPPDAPGAFDLLIGDTRVVANAGDGDSGHLAGLPFGSYSVREVIAEGVDDFSVRTVCIDQSSDPPAELIDIEGPEAMVTLSREHSDIQCTITNTHIPPPPEPAHLTVVKRLTPSDDAGTFDLLVDGKTWAYGVRDGGRTDRLAFEAPHTATVGERGADGTDLADYDISTVCRSDGGDGRTIARGSGRRTVRVPLEAGDDGVCVIENTRVAYPTVPEGGRVDATAPPDPCLDPGVCGNVAAAPNLAIGETMPHTALVGETMPVSITVKNVGYSTAREVRLHERPPTGRPLVTVASPGSLRRDGTAAWRLGNLEPGETRTVRVTARVTRWGLHLNRAVASAANTDPALAQATVRATGVSPSRPAPRVTG